MTTVYCAGPHSQPVPLYVVDELPAEVTRPAPHGALCGDCGEVYAAGIAAPVMVEQLDEQGRPVTDETGAPVMVPNLARLVPGQVPTLPAVTAHKRRRTPDWTPTRDNYGPPTKPAAPR